MERRKAIVAGAMRLAQVLTEKLRPKTKFETNTQAAIIRYFSEEAERNDVALGWFDDALTWIDEALRDSKQNPKALFMHIVNRETAYDRKTQDKPR